MKIALAHAYSWPQVRRGGERLVDDLCSYLRRSGHTVDVFSGTRGESEFRVTPQGRNHRLHIPWTKALEGYGLTPTETFGARALTPLLMHRYDAVHAFTPTAALAGLVAGHPTVYTVLGHPTADTLPPRRLARAPLTTAVGMSTEVAALSASARDSIEVAFGRVPHVLPPGIYVDRFTPKELPVPGPLRILFSGDASNPDKGVGVLLRAFTILLERHPDARLALSGPGNPDVVLREMGPSRDKLSASIDLLGEGDVDDVPARYRDAHVTILPSRDEAFGIVLLESLACGTPVIGGEPGGASDIIDTSDIGRLVAYGDAEGLVDAIEDCATLARDPVTLKHCRAAAERWDWSSIGPMYERLYRSVTTRRRLPGAAILQAVRLRLGDRGERSVARP